MPKITELTSSVETIILNDKLDTWIDMEIYSPTTLTNDELFDSIVADDRAEDFLKEIK